MAKAKGGTAVAEEAVVQTTDRIVDAAMLRSQALALRGEFRLMVQGATAVIKKLDEHEVGACLAHRAGEQTMLFPSMAAARMETLADTVDSMHTAVAAAHAHWDPAGEEE